MSRLTKKNINGYDLVEKGKVYYVWQNEITEKTINKLGKLEDLEEELGCPLEVLIKPLLNGGIIDNDGYGVQLTGLAINGDGSLSFIAINGEYYDLKDYQKTWFLEGEKNE